MDESRNCHAWTTYFPYRIFFNRNVGYRETWVKTLTGIKKTLTLFVKFVTRRWRYPRTYLGSGAFG